jgi:hypothetical protein
MKPGICETLFRKLTSLPQLAWDKRLLLLLLLLFRKLNYRVWEHKNGHGGPLCRVQAFKFESASDRMDVSELPVLWHKIFKFGGIIGIL